LNGYADRFSAELGALEPFAADGLVTIDEDRICIAPAGRPLVRSVCAVFDAYLDRGAGRHSRAV
jgi:oxygen-independent coproporphyrinogen-3 oxidase